MGGYGSGRNIRSASKSDEFHKLDLATFRPEWFAHLRRGSVSWSRGGHKTGSISYETSPQNLRLFYSIGREGQRENIDESFNLVFTDQHFGGQRRWILCKCGKRCRVLYGGKRFRCRQCYRLTFASQYERFRVPGMAKAERVRDKYGMQAGFAYSFGDRPKGMHWKTYYRLRERDCAMSEAIDRALMGQFERYTVKGK